MARRLGGLLAALAVLAVLSLLLHRQRAVRVPVSDSTVITADLTPADLDVPVPPGAKPVGRITRQESTTGSTTQALLEVALPPARVITFYTTAWPGARHDRGGAAGPAVFVHRQPGHHHTVRVDGQAQVSRLFVVCRQPPPGG